MDLLLLTGATGFLEPIRNIQDLRGLKIMVANLIFARIDYIL